MTARTPRFVYATSTTLDGHLADVEHSLDWLFAVQGGEEALAELEPFTRGVTVMVEGSSTYRWMVEAEDLTHHPEKWANFYGTKTTFVFTGRPDEQPVVPGADVRFVSGPVTDHLDAIVALAGEGDVWIVGGGDLATQFADAGRLDELHLSLAPVVLGAGAPLLTGRWEADRLELLDVHATGQFIQARYRVRG